MKNNTSNGEIATKRHTPATRLCAWSRVATGALIVLMALGVLASPASAAFLDMPSIVERPDLDPESYIEVPEVKKRPPDPKAGPHILIYEIKLQGVRDNPKYGIKKEEIDAIIEDARQEFMRVRDLTDSGFTIEELGEIANLLAEISEGKKADEVTEQDVQKLVALVQRQISKRGLTFGQIEAIAERITTYYRERGFFLAKAYVPAQEVRDGVIGLTVLEGDLGEVAVTGNERYKSKTLQREFKGIIGKPVTYDQIEEKLYLLNDYPGLDVYGYFKPGKQIGDTQMNLQVRDENRWSFSARADNHGTDLTGEYRFYGELLWHNPLRIGDQLLLGGLATVDPTNSLYGQARYRLPLFTSRTQLSFGVTNNQFVLDEGASQALGGLDVDGDSTIYDVTLEQHLVRGRRRNWTVLGSYADKETTLDSDELGNLGLDDEFITWSAGTNFDALFEKLRMLHQGSFTFIYGEIDQTGILNPDTEFYKYVGDYSMLTFIPIPFTKASTRLVTRVSGQFSEEVLPSMEQFSVAGANTVRAYEINQFSADKAIYAGADWLFNMPRFLSFRVFDVPFYQMVQPLVFFDYGYGEQNIVAFATQEETAELIGWGYGVELAYKDMLSGRVQVARRIHDDFSNDELDAVGDDTTFLFDVQYRFR